MVKHASRGTSSERARKAPGERRKAPKPARPKPAARPRNRLSRADWVQGALEALAERGLGALGVEALAERLGVTKGSFYWHFRDSEELLQALVARWEELAVDRVMGDLAELRSPCDVLRRIIERTVSIEHPERRLRYRVEAAAAALAEWHPVVRPAYVRITDRRLNGLVMLYLATGVSAPEASRLGRLAYMTLLGVYPVLLTRTRFTEPEKRELVAQLCERLLPQPCAPAAGPFTPGKRGHGKRRTPAAGSRSPQRSSRRDNR